MNYIEALTGVNRFSGDLSQSERSVLSFILERTLRFNKLTERIPLRHFLDGVVSMSGEVIVGGLGVGRTTLKNAVQSLKRKRLVRVVKCQETGENVFTVAVEVMEKLFTMAKLKIGKEYKRLREGKGGGSKSDPGVGQNPTLNNNNNGEHPQVFSPSLRSGREDAASPRTARHVAGQITQEYEDKRQSKIESLCTKYPNRDKVRRAFTASLRRHYDDRSIPIFSPSKRDWGQYRNFLKATDFGKGFEYPDFFEWSIAYWADVLDRELRWLKGNVPQVPDLPFFCRMQKYFLHAYFDDELRRIQAARMSALKAGDSIQREYEIVCKDNQKLKDQLAENRITHEQRRLLEDAPEQLRLANLAQQRLRQKIKTLQMENARMRNSNGQTNADLADPLPTWDELIEAERLASGLDS